MTDSVQNQLFREQHADYQEIWSVHFGRAKHCKVLRCYNQALPLSLPVCSCVSSVLLTCTAQGQRLKHVSIVCLIKGRQSHAVSNHLFWLLLKVGVCGFQMVCVCACVCVCGQGHRMGLDRLLESANPILPRSGSAPMERDSLYGTSLELTLEHTTQMLVLHTICYIRHSRCLIERETSKLDGFQKAPGCSWMSFGGFFPFGQTAANRFSRLFLWSGNADINICSW